MTSENVAEDFFPFFRRIDNGFVEADEVGIPNDIHRNIPGHRLKAEAGSSGNDLVDELQDVLRYRWYF
ncbi:hypothetical protein D3C71_1738990 [compost metagenome]